MNVKEKSLCEYHDDVLIFANFEYDDALIGVTMDNRAVYSFDKMIECIIKEEGLSDIEAIERIEYDIAESLADIGGKAPIIMYSVDWLGV